MSGWIALHRSLRDHWLFSDARNALKLRAWIGMLMDANWKTTEVEPGKFGDLTCVQRGQILSSERNLAERYQFPRSTFQRFLMNLEQAQMVRVKRATNWALITIVNYEEYQRVLDPRETDLGQTVGPEMGQVRATDGPLVGTSKQGNNTTREQLNTNSAPQGAPKDSNFSGEQSATPKKPTSKRVRKSPTVDELLSEIQWPLMWSQHEQHMMRRWLEYKQSRRQLYSRASYVQSHVDTYATDPVRFVAAVNFSINQHYHALVAPKAQATPRVVPLNNPQRAFADLKRIMEEEA